MIIDKIQDLLAMEFRASEIYRKVFPHTHSKKHQEILSRMMNDELSHIELVNGMLNPVDR